MTSQSQIKIARRCMKKHDYKFNQRLQRKVKGAPLFRGTILHEMIEARCLGKDPYAVSRKYAKEYRKLFREEQEMYGETFIEDIDRVFSGYERAYANEKLKYEHIEKAGEVKLPNGLKFRYIVDKIARDKDGRRWLMDHKSCKNIPSEDVRFSDLQLVLYFWAWNKENPKEPIDGIIWDYLRTKPPTVPEVLKSGELTKRANIDTDYYTYSIELQKQQLDPRPYAELLGNLKKRGSMDFFQRITLPSPSNELVQSVVADAATTAEYIELFGKTVQTRNLTRDCSWDCDYYRLCHAEMRGLDADFVKKTDFEEKDPDERYAKESE